MTIVGIDDLKSEFRCDADGKAFVTKRGLARLCGVKHTSWGQHGYLFTSEVDNKLKSSIEGGSQETSKIAESLADKGFDGGSQETSKIAVDKNDSNLAKYIPDIIAARVIKYYAYKGVETAQQIDEAIAAVGLRIVIQNVMGWQSPSRPPTREEIVELCCLPVATLWEQRFSQEYYAQLARLTNLESKGYKKPSQWGKLTKELVYDWLPDGVYQAIKRCQQETGRYSKLHQFLSEEGVTVLEKHQRLLLTLMESASSLDDLRRLLYAGHKKQYQLVLF